MCEHLDPNAPGILMVDNIYLIIDNHQSLIWSLIIDTIYLANNLKEKNITVRVDYFK